MHHPVTKLEQPNGQTHKKAGYQSKEQGQTTMKRCSVEIKAPMLTSKAMHKQNPTNAQVSEANEIQ